MLENLHDFILKYLTRFFEWSFSNITDPSFWLGLGTSIAVLFFVALRGASNMAGGHIGRILVGMWYDNRRDYRDIINVTLAFFVTDTQGRKKLHLDTILGDRPLSALFCNPYVAYVARSASFTTNINNPIVRYTPKSLTNKQIRRRKILGWLLKPFGLKKFFRVYTAQETQAETTRRRRTVYDPAVSHIAEVYTNLFVILSAIGVPSKWFKVLVFHTYEIIPANELRSQHHRLRMIFEHDLLSLPETIEETDIRLKSHFKVLKAMQREYIAWQQNPSEATKTFGVVDVPIPQFLLQGLQSPESPTGADLARLIKVATTRT